MGAERGFPRNIGDMLTIAPARYLVSKGVTANEVTRWSLMTGLLGETLIFNNRIIEEKTGGLVSAKAAKIAGISFYALSLYLDILDGKVATLSPEGPTKFGALADHTVDGILETAIGVFGFAFAKNDQERKVYVDFLKRVRRPSTVRAIGESYEGIRINELDIGSRFARIPLTLAALWSEDHRTTFIELVTAQAEDSSAWRLLAIERSGNKQAITQVTREFVLEDRLFDLTRIGRPRSLSGILLSQVVSAGFSSFAKARKVWG